VFEQHVQIGRRCPPAVAGVGEHAGAEPRRCNGEVGSIERLGGQARTRSEGAPRVPKEYGVGVMGRAKPVSPASSALAERPRPCQILTVMGAYRDPAERVLCVEEGVTLTTTRLVLADQAYFPLNPASISAVVVDDDWKGPAGRIVLLSVAIGLLVAWRYDDLMYALFVPGLCLIVAAPFTVRLRHRLTIRSGGAVVAAHVFRSEEAATRMMLALKASLPLPAATHASNNPSEPVPELSSTNRREPTQVRDALGRIEAIQQVQSKSPDPGRHASALADEANVLRHVDQESASDAPKPSRKP
jgi:hypothetical protein